MSDIYTGAEFLIRVNGSIKGFVTNFSWNITQGQKMSFGVDSSFPSEIAQGAAPSFVSGSMTVFKLKNTSLEESGFLAPRTPGSSPIASQVHQAAARYSLVEIVDRQTKTTVVRMTQVMFGNQSWSVESKGIMTGSMTFQGVLADSTQAQSFF